MVQLAAHAKSSTLYGRTIVWSYGRTVVRSYGRTVVRSYSRTVVRSYGRTIVRSYSCMVLRLYGCTVIRLYSCTVIHPDFFGYMGYYYFVMYRFSHTLQAPLWSNVQNTFNYAFYMNSILFFIICTICNEDLSQIFLLKSSLIWLSSKFSPCCLWCSATLFIL